MNQGDYFQRKNLVEKMMFHRGDQDREIILSSTFLQIINSIKVI